MKITGKLTKKGKVQVIKSKDGEKQWNKQLFLIDTGSQYDNIICFELFGDKTSELESINEGSNIDVEFNIKCQEYNGQYYTKLSAWKLSGGGTAAPAQEDSNDDLPF